MPEIPHLVGQFFFISAKIKANTFYGNCNCCLNFIKLYLKKCGKLFVCDSEVI